MLFSSHKAKYEFLREKLCFHFPVQDVPNVLKLKSAVAFSQILEFYLFISVLNKQEAWSL